jgi:glycosyltransferase involved in cell wall biosynthesis
MKKVILITSTFPNEKKGGVPSYVENRALYLSKRFNVTVCGLGKSYLIENVVFKSVGRSFNFKYFFFFYWLKLIIVCLRNRKSIIEIHNIPVAFPIFFIFKCRYFFHGPSRLEAQVEGASIMTQKLKNFVEKICLKRSKKILVVSKAFEKLLRDEHSKKLPKIGLVLPKFKYKPIFFDGVISSSDNLNFVIVRRLVKRTGVIPFVQLFFRMLESKNIQDNCKLHIAGNGPEKQKLIDLISKSAFKKNVNYIGFISEEEKIELFKKADFNIVPTLKLEGFGLVIIEAGICGCMSIVTNVGGMPEVIGYLSNQGIIFKLTEADSIKTFEGLRKKQYDKNVLHKITKKTFYFD